MVTAMLDADPTCLVSWRTATSKARERCPGSMSTPPSSLGHASPSDTMTDVPFSCARTWKSSPSSTSLTPIRVKESCVGWK